MNKNPQWRVAALQGIGEDSWGLVKPEHPPKEGEVHSSGRPRFRTQEETRKDSFTRKDPTAMVKPTAVDGLKRLKARTPDERQ